MSFSVSRNGDDDPHKPEAFASGLGAIPADRVSSCGLWPLCKTACARRAGHACRDPPHSPRKPSPPIAPFTPSAQNGPPANATRQRSRKPMTPRVFAIRSRAFLTGFAILMVFGSIVVCSGMARRACWRAPCLREHWGSSFSTPSSPPVRLASSRKSGELSQAGGAAERLSELLREVPAIRDPESPLALHRQPAEKSASTRSLHLSNPHQCRRHPRSFIHRRSR